MKKIIVLMLAAVIACFAAFAETGEESILPIGGIVTGITENGGYIVENAEYGEVEILINEETYTETMRDIMPGDFIYVEYDGMMTRSLPPQVTADAVRMYVAEGDITEVFAEENAVMLMTESHGEMYVTLPEEWKDAQTDVDHMTIYFDGVMTMSLPPRVNAAYVVPGYSLQGEVTEIAEGYILIGEGMETVQVGTENIELPGDMKTGDIIRVIFDGQMTRSIPAQITAQEIVQISR